MNQVTGRNGRDAKLLQKGRLAVQCSLHCDVLVRTQVQDHLHREERSASALAGLQGVTRRECPARGTRGASPGTVCCLLHNQTVTSKATEQTDAPAETTDGPRPASGPGRSCPSRHILHKTDHQVPPPPGPAPASTTATGPWPLPWAQAGMGEKTRL